MREMTRDEAVNFLREGTRTGKLATVRADGRLHVVPIWFIVEGDEVVFTTWHDSVKARNLRRDPRASLIVDLEQPPYSFVMVEGEARFIDDEEELLRVATENGRRYMGGDRAEEFGRRNAVEGEEVVRLRIVHIVAQGDVAD